MDRNTLLSWPILVLLMTALPVAVVSASESVPRETLQRQFMETLNRGQIVRLLETLDRQRKLTDPELGAKYRWGRIPVDRTPPLELARWWENLTPRERRRERIEWFQDHSDQLDLDLSARILGMSDRLTELYRRLRKRHRQSDVQLQPIHVARDLRLEGQADRSTSSGPSPDRDTPRTRRDKQTPPDGASPKTSSESEVSDPSVRSSAKRTKRTGENPSAPSQNEQGGSSDHPSDNQEDWQLQSGKDGIKPVAPQEGTGENAPGTDVAEPESVSTDKETIEPDAEATGGKRRETETTGESSPALNFPPPEIRSHTREPPPLPEPELREVR